MTNWLKKLLVGPSPTHSTPPYSVDERILRGVVIFVALGVFARAVRFFLKFPLWEDECFLCVNFIDASYWQLLTEPLVHHQVAPLLFLWGEHTMVSLFGYSEWSLRLIPFLASIASLLIFPRMVSRICNGWPLLLAVAVFAVAYPGVRYAAEAKQYATDLFASMLLTWFVLEWAVSKNSRWLWGFALWAPIAVLLSFPAVFVAGGLCAAVTYSWLKDRSDFRSTVLPWSIGSALMLASFALNYFTVIQTQGDAENNFMSAYWSNALPPVTTPWNLPAWLILTHSGDFLAWPVGDNRGGSSLTFLACLIGCYALFRRQQRLELVILLAPLLVHMLAAALQKYPYGGHVKFSMPHGPTLCLLFGLGEVTFAVFVLRHLLKNVSWRRIYLQGMCVLFSLICLGSIARDVVNPYKTYSDERARAFAQWFWFDVGEESEVQAVLADEHTNRPFMPGLRHELTWAAMFECNWAIYRRNSQHAADDANRPLTCVVYRDAKLEFDDAALSDWQQRMESEHGPAVLHRYPLPRYTKDNSRCIKVDHLDVFVFDRSKQIAGLESDTVTH
ncbi:glycosyltransferase family 39 protein [Calycomorphotria hydatis]|uniref:Glycosyltransferase RgtA/B/C/D-like domain-containing protein n=1 Tax=Calycomorphotria hydatis TaxID=2528027 RepID=A0A517TCI2_9PLAN|nr:glycosyltransferase family 39 protein [Calycomorphotria hydatis]QDT66076.1 hypothetical protein V22_33400 [Calycomorphotria hydatis]